MHDRSSILRRIFSDVKERLIDPKRTDSLQRFIKQWKGKNAGIEGWLRVEFVAAIDPEFATVETGSAHKRGEGEPGKKYPDLRIKPKTAGGTPIEVELKSGGNWFIGKSIIRDYHGKAVFFLCAELHDKFDKRYEWLKKHGNPCDLVQICEDLSTDSGGCDWLFGFLDLGAGS